MLRNSIIRQVFIMTKSTEKNSSIYSHRVGTSIPTYGEPVSFFSYINYSSWFEVTGVLFDIYDCSYIDRSIRYTTITTLIVYPELIWFNVGTLRDFK